VAGWVVTVAGSTLLVSIPDEQVIAFRERRRSQLVTDLSIRCSEILTSWVRPDDLRNLLRLALDGGQPPRSDLWHPQRVPMWHPSEAASEIDSKLRKVWNELRHANHPPDSSDWYVVEISKVLKVLEHPAASHSGIVSFRQRPLDEARAKRVLIPVVTTATTGSQSE
jgi:hypothetical protein